MPCDTAEEATVELARLIDLLSSPSAYPEPTEEIEARQTHISAVFLTGRFAYKIKKPVRFDFLDFSTLEKRHHYCAEEVRLNRRLAPEVYLGVVPITAAEGGLMVEGAGEAIEWAVKMQRLPEEATLHKRIRCGEVGVELAGRLGQRIAAFHREAVAPPDRAAFSRFEAVARNLRDIFEQSAHQVGSTVSRAVWERTRELIEDGLFRLRPLIEARSARGMTRATHGDLHLDHVYHFPERQPPADLIAMDCIEFSERFRFTDPVADAAFLVMDFAFHDRRDLGSAFADAYFQESNDEEGRSLLPLYTAYRATVRGLVDGLKQEEKEVPEEQRLPALASARAHWLLALGEGEEPGRRPCLVLVAGLPGTGKSTLARALAEQAHFHLLRSDEVRKELAGLSPHEPTPVGSRGELYSPEWSARTYAECLRRAEALLEQGGRVLVDANFREERRRRMFLDAATRWGVPGLMLLCRADAETVRQRLEGRCGDASDADWQVYRMAAAGWEEPGPTTTQALREVPTDGDQQHTLQACLKLLRSAALFSLEEWVFPRTLVRRF